MISPQVVREREKSETLKHFYYLFLVKNFTPSGEGGREGSQKLGNFSLHAEDSSINETSYFIYFLKNSSNMIFWDMEMYT